MDNETIGCTPAGLREMNGGRDRFRTCGLYRVKASRVSSWPGSTPAGRWSLATAADRQCPWLSAAHRYDVAPMWPDLLCRVTVMSPLALWPSTTR
jgi:hypothetical protein